MKEGFWIDSRTGDFREIDEHARWIRRPENGRLFGLPEEIIRALGETPWDFNSAGRKAILLAAMEHGLIRARGHGAHTTFEFTISWVRWLFRFS